MLWAVPTPHPGLPFALQGDLIVLAQTVLGEAEGETYAGKLAVAWVVKNRLDDVRWPDTWSGVCLQPKQFSAFNSGSPRVGPMANPIISVDERAWTDSFRAAIHAFFGIGADPTNGANHYAVKTLDPKWAKGKPVLVVIGQHKFWKL